MLQPVVKRERETPRRCSRDFYDTHHNDRDPDFRPAIGSPDPGFEFDRAGCRGKIIIGNKEKSMIAVK